MNSLATVIGDYRTFLTTILREIEDAGFDLNDFVQLDHLCYRVPTIERYEVKKQEAFAYGTLLDEARINGRPIAVFRLATPIIHERWRIDALEIPAPREGTTPAEGLEHIELVLYDDKEAFIKKYADKALELKNADRGVNPEIIFALPTYNVKFHLLNLPAAVYLQKKLGMDDIRDGQ